MKFYVVLEDERVYCIMLGWNMKYYAIIYECLYYKGHKLGKVMNILSEEQYASIYGGN